MKKRALLAIVMISAVCLSLTLAGCDNTVYPNIEDAGPVFETVAEIESYDCDVFITYAGESALAGGYASYNSYSLKLIQLNDEKAFRYLYSIQKPAKVFLIDNKTFFYYDNELQTGTPQEGEEAPEMPFIPVSPFFAELERLSYTATYPATNRSLFEAEYTESKLKELAALAAGIDKDKITKCAVSIEADNKTMLPVSVTFTVDCDFTVGENTFTGAVQIKYAFKKFNKPLTIGYPDEVKEYLEKNYPEFFKAEEGEAEAE
jgi:hypothetical protein